MFPPIKLARKWLIGACRRYSLCYSGLVVSLIRLPKRCRCWLRWIRKRCNIYWREFLLVSIRFDSTDVSTVQVWCSIYHLIYIQIRTLQTMSNAVASKLVVFYNDTKNVNILNRKIFFSECWWNLWLDPTNLIAFLFLQPCSVSVLGTKYCGKCCN